VISRLAISATRSGGTGDEVTHSSRGNIARSRRDPTMPRDRQSGAPLAVMEVQPPPVAGFTWMYPPASSSSGLWQ